MGAMEAGWRELRPREPVRRQSRYRGRCEVGFWRPVTRHEVRRIVLGARRYDLEGRGRGKRNGPLGHVALEILAFLANVVSYKTGRLDPSLDTLTARLKRSRGAIVAALARLREHGFLDWLRRYVPTGQTEGHGPRVKQTSNAYRMVLPARAARMLRPPIPIPDDAQAHREALGAAYRGFVADTPLTELPAVSVEDSGLARALASMARALQNRESSRCSESHS